MFCFKKYIDDMDKPRYTGADYVHDRMQRQDQAMAEAWARAEQPSVTQTPTPNPHLLATRSVLSNETWYTARTHFSAPISFVPSIPSMAMTDNRW